LAEYTADVMRRFGLSLAEHHAVYARERAASAYAGKGIRISNVCVHEAAL
jgi:hypothetical protein